ncbi:nucleoside hydrolase [Allomuricauda sp. SCSIO 65647]|uniref:nucleoside hydrolase n=1 Tax=Allomuricauda sp. SCSIO 65647 TaxID=2908843 RepID=UPI001F28671D|nr:nucleoside hydrolase [Muricauda sp. SCSIO 65647]UJH67048.1 nucleoside hydrolase [Muricauda sp. SCSIO 65647]
MRTSMSFFLISYVLISCGAVSSRAGVEHQTQKLAVIFDTDANNELDDQHALAYLFSNQEYFDIKAITVNATRNGGAIDGHYDEAERIMKLFNVEQKIPLIKGANKSFSEIKDDLKKGSFDGYKAVDFIISEAKKHTREKLVVLAVGKLTNVALALKKDPSIVNNIRLVWLGANYPDSGEYNLDNDIESMNYVLNTDIPFEMVTVRYGKPSGTDAVRVTQEEINTKMPGLGPKAKTPIVGRHGDRFDNFGDYSVNLFTHIDYHSDPPTRSLFDMAAVAIVKNPEWARATEIPCPVMVDKVWIERPENSRKIIIWEDFDKENIIKDFYNGLNKFN